MSNMNFTQLIEERFSVRKYKDKKIDRELILKILEAGRMAPSAVNFQPWHFIVIEEKKVLEEIQTAYSRNWIKEAPVIIVVCADHELSWKRRADGKDFADVDVAIAVDHMTLQATNLGLGTCWVCNFDVNKCIHVLGLPSQIEPLVMLPLGYPDIEIPTKKRKSLEEIVHWNKFIITSCTYMPIFRFICRKIR